MNAASSGVAHLLIVHLGPVQEFIAQARRTRDLWFGSHLLSELSRAGARAAAAYGALVFPALDAGDPALAPSDDVGGAPATARSVANKLIVELRPDVAPETAAEAVRAAVGKRWHGIADEVRNTYRADLADGIDAVWDEQIGSLVELGAAWAPIDRGYTEVRRAVEAALTGRRRLRDFQPIRHHREGAPASSLDGGRVSVLPGKGTRRRSRAEQRLLLGADESLDAVGVVKRRGGAPEQFLSVVHVAVLPWLRHVAASPGAALLESLRAACGALTIVDDESGVRRRLERIARPDLPGAALFPYNASLLFASRLPAVFEELGASPERAAREAEAWDRERLRPLIAAGGAPHAYVACLVADGDHMGGAIDSLRSADAHRALARVLGAFPAAARHIVEQDHDGALVYAGGDDVLAFVPVCRAVSCADALRRAFHRTVGEAIVAARTIDRQSGHEASETAAPPTLSVGLGVGHVLDSLGHLRALGRRAERVAKLRRNALAVLVDPRSGGEHVWSASWDDDPAARLAADVALLDRDDGLPMTKVHELAQLQRRLSAPRSGGLDHPVHPASLDQTDGARLLAGEVVRILARSRRGTAVAGLTPAEVGLAIAPDSTFASVHRDLERWVARLQIARALASSRPAKEPLR